MCGWKLKEEEYRKAVCGKTARTVWWGDGGNPTVLLYHAKTIKYALNGLKSGVLSLSVFYTDWLETLFFIHLAKLRTWNMRRVETIELLFALRDYGTDILGIGWDYRIVVNNIYEIVRCSVGIQCFICIEIIVQMNKRVMKMIQFRI